MVEIIGIILLVGVLIGRWSKRSAPDETLTKAKLEARNYEWAQFIAAYRQKVKAKAEKALVERMLGDISKQGLPVPAQVFQADSTSTMATSYNQQPTAMGVAAQTADQAIYVPSIEAYVPPPARPSTPIDNAIILLYFGAFLFLSAVGLFLAFGGLPGAAKSALVAFLVMVFYASGQWFFRASTRFRPAGVAFIGIGLILLPFFGLSLHTETFNNEQGALVWGVTSLIAIGLYWHALVTTRQPYVTYSFIAAILSLFESGVSIANLPTYYFALMMALVSVVFLVISRYKKDLQDLQEPLLLSSNWLLPIALLLSLFYIPTQGFAQSALALLLAAAFYGVSAWLVDDSYRNKKAVLGSVLLAASVSMGVYSLTHELSAVAPTLTIVAALELVGLAALRHNKLLPPKLISDLLLVVAALPLIACVAVLDQPALLSACLFSTIAFMVSVHTLTRDPGYISVGSALFFVWVITMGVYWQSWNAVSYTIAFAGLFIMFIGQRLRHSIGSPLALIYRSSYSLALFATYMAAAFSGWKIAALASVVLAVLGEILSRYEKKTEYRVGSIALQYLALLAASFGLSDSQQVPILALLIGGLSLAHYLAGTLIKFEASYYYRVAGLVGSLIGAACVLVANGVPAWFMLADLVLFCALSVAESVRTRNPQLLAVSLGFQQVAAMWLAGLLPGDSQGIVAPAVMIGLAALQVCASVYGPSLTERAYWRYSAMVALLLGAATVILFGETNLLMIASLVLFSALSFYEYKISRQQGLLAASIIAQYVSAVWLSTRIDVIPDAVIVPLAFGVVAAAQYMASLTDKNEEARIWSTASLCGFFGGAVSWIAFDDVRVPMIIDLGLAGAVIVNEGHRIMSVGRRELGYGVIMAAFQWGLYFIGLREVQVYTHLWVALLAAFAYMRNQLADGDEERAYTKAALAVLSVPLFFQALGDAGDFYGWLFIIEHMLLMMVGMVIRRRYVVWWGLLGATLAILYQLRELAFAALGFLAVVVIGIAVYVLSRHGDKIEPAAPHQHVDPPSGESPH